MNWSGALLSVYTQGIHWMNEHLLACPFKKFLHIECPGCGFQRSLLFLFQGKFLDSFRMYPATLPLLSVLVISILHIKLKFRHGASIIKYLQLSVAIVIAVFYIYKIVHHKIAA
jgi:hypothetical protein